MIHAKHPPPKARDSGKVRNLFSIGNEKLKNGKAKHKKKKKLIKQWPLSLMYLNITEIGRQVGKIKKMVVI